MSARSQSHTLLTDEEISRFITDGYLVLDSDVSPFVHARIDERLQSVLRSMGNPGNNILPAVPELQQILDSPRLQGALKSVLGANYLLHPHRFAHNNEPSEEREGVRVAGSGTRAFVGWHQDDHSPLSRPRHHYPRYAMVLYYPSDTPVERGPTQLIPATHLNRSLPEAERQRGFPVSGAAGTCVLVHFDIGHGASLNLSDRTRMMVKFVFVRTEEPVTPSWNCRDTAWRTPPAHQSPQENTVVWQHLWDWMSGRNPSTTATAKRAAQIPALLAALGDTEPSRQAAIYTLAAIGEPAVQPLCDLLSGCDRNGWNEGAVVMEDAAYALAALGQTAVPALLHLLQHESEWVQINAIFALGEMGARAAESVPALLEKLRSTAHPVVRTTLDALGQIRVGTRAALPDIHRLLTEENPDWKEPLSKAWSGQDQVRVNAMMALIRMGAEAADAEATVLAALDDSCGYLSGFGVEYLRRQGTPHSLPMLLNHLAAHRWDSTLQQGIHTF